MRVGRIGYINCYPVYGGIDRGVIPLPADLVTGTPSELNELLAAAELDVSVVSAVEYARNARDYVLLPDLAISCDGPVRSVALFSRRTVDRKSTRLNSSHSQISYAAFCLKKKKPYGRFRMKGSQFPTDAYDNFVRQIVPRWTTTDDAIIAAYTALVDRVCPCVLLFHSQAGQFGFRVAQARPDKVKALIAVEPAGQGDPKQVDRLKAIPTLFVYGDNIEKDARWPQIRKNGVAFADAMRAAGAKVEVVDLPQAGIRGNSHMLMMDRNNLEVAALIQRWLEQQGLYR